MKKLQNSGAILTSYSNEASRGVCTRSEMFTMSIFLWNQLVDENITKKLEWRRAAYGPGGLGPIVIVWKV